MLLAALLACTPAEPPPAEAPPPAPTPPAAHPSSGACADCHAAEAAAWNGSHHAQASGTTLHPERFDGRLQGFGGLRVTPRLEDGVPRFEIRDGAGTRTWTVTGVIGVEPLQQYLLAGDRGRVVVAPVAWDVAAGRWFDPAPDGVAADPADPLYWAGMAGNWNHLCGECHTTGYEKGYDLASDGYHSTSTHPVVACEACHGAGAEVTSLTGAAEQIRACTPCHSRRESLAYRASPESPLLDSVRPALVDGGVFEPDGRTRPRDEPFEWGAFSQSGMARAGVRCSDCHDPHTGRTRAEGDATCTGCHADVRAQHPSVPSPTACVSCHMPTRLYMGIHARHDHGMYPPGPTRLGPTWTAGLAGDPAASPALVALAADPTETSFVRASAAALLRRAPPHEAARLRGLLGDPDALVRLAVTETLGAWGDLPLSSLSDPTRAVRQAAFRGVIGLGAPAALRTPAFEAARIEFEAGVQVHGDLASAWQNLGVVRSALGDRPGAAEALRQALARDPSNAALRRGLEALTPPP